MCPRVSYLVVPCKYSHRFVVFLQVWLITNPVKWNYMSRKTTSIPFTLYIGQNGLLYHYTDIVRESRRAKSKKGFVFLFLFCLFVCLFFNLVKLWYLLWYFVILRSGKSRTLKSFWSDVSNNQNSIGLLLLWLLFRISEIRIRVYFPSNDSVNLLH